MKKKIRIKDWLDGEINVFIRETRVEREKSSSMTEST